MQVLSSYICPGIGIIPTCSLDLLEPRSWLQYLTTYMYAGSSYCTTNSAKGLDCIPMKPEIADIDTQVGTMS